MQSKAIVASPPKMRGLAAWLGLYALVAGAICFGGWAFDVPRLTDWFNEGISIQPNTAFLVVLAGAAVLLMRFRCRRLAASLGGLLALAGGLNLLQYILGADFGFDRQLLFGRSWGRRILIVDDSRDSAESLAMLLRLSGNETFVAYDGEEAVRAAARLRPEVVLLDIGLPGLNGFDACRRIRENPWASNVHIIALTGWGQQDDRRKSNEAGFDGHLVKPVEHAELLRLLDRRPPQVATQVSV